MVVDMVVGVRVVQAVVQAAGKSRVVGREQVGSRSVDLGGSPASCSNQAHMLLCSARGDTRGVCCVGGVVCVGDMLRPPLGGPQGSRSCPPGP